MRADFYLIDKDRFRAQPLLLVCELARKAYAASQPLLVLARDSAQAEALDDLLWSFDPDEYLPHQIAGMDEDDDEAPILIATQDMDVPARPLLLNLRDDPPAGRFERVLEVVSQDEEQMRAGRDRFRRYKQLGYEVRHHVITPDRSAGARTGGDA